MIKPPGSKCCILYSKLFFELQTSGSLNLDVRLSTQEFPVFISQSKQTFSWRHFSQSHSYQKQLPATFFVQLIHKLSSFQNMQPLSARFYTSNLFCWAKLWLLFLGVRSDVQRVHVWPIITWMLPHHNQNIMSLLPSTRI